MSVLDNEKMYQRYFEEICQIPHGSGNEKALSDYLVEFAKKQGLAYHQDSVNNVVIYKPATKGYEQKETIALQAHIDMVNEKNADVEHDFTKDPIKLYIEDGYLKAEGTTLGGDDGAGVAMIMAVLADNDLNHPALEAIFTTEEESTMIGAFNLDSSLLKAKKMINIDAEDETCTNTCSAGGEDIYIQRAFNQQLCDLRSYKLEIKGLLGGHSGAEIHTGKANAIKLAARVLHDLKEQVPINLVSFNGGLKINAICREAFVIFATNADVKKLVANSCQKIKKELELVDPGFYYELESYDAEMMYSLNDSNAIIDLTYVIPSGMRQFSQELNVTIASENLGVISTNDGIVKLEISTRGANDSYVEQLKQELFTLAKVFEFNYNCDNWYPAWDYMPHSQLRDKMAEVYQMINGKEIKMEAIHGGLECGIFKEKIPNLDIVTLGPNLYDVHTPDEKLDLASFDRTYNFLCKLLENL